MFTTQAYVDYNSVIGERTVHYVVTIEIFPYMDYNIDYRLI